MRKVLATMTTSLVMAALASGPALAIQAGEGENPPNSSDLEDLLDGLDTVNSGDGAVNPTGAVGTAWTAANVVRVIGGDRANPDLAMRLVDTKVVTTTDHTRLGLQKNVARGQATLASVFARGVVHDASGSAVLVPSQPLHGESYSGENHQRYCLDPDPDTCAAEAPIQLPSAGSSFRAGDIEWENVRSDVRFAMGLLDSAATEANRESGGHLKTTSKGEVIIPLPSGSQEVVAGAGTLVDGLVHPASIDTHMTEGGGAAAVQSSVKHLAMLAGLTEVNNAGPGRQMTEVSANGAAAETVLMSVDEMTVLNTDALLRLLGIDSSQLPMEVLAELADAAGIHTGRLNQAVVGARNWSSVKDLQAAATRLRAAGTAFAASGGCGLITSVLREDAVNAGIALPDCLDLPGTVAAFVAAVNRFGDDVAAAILASVGEESVVAIQKLNASVGASAAVEPDGDTEMVAQTWGGIEKIMAAGVVQKLDLRSGPDQWNRNEELLNRALCEFTSVLGPEFCDVVRIRLVPTLTERRENVDGRYARATSTLDLMNVYINLPGRDAVEQAVANLLANAESGAGEVTDVINGVLPDVGGGGGVGLPLGRAAVDDPMTITVGGLVAQAEHMHPDVTLACPDSQRVCDSSTHRQRAWDPRKGLGGPGTSDTDLPRTGGSGGNTPIAIASGLGVVAFGLRRWLTLLPQVPTRGRAR